MRSNLSGLVFLVIVVICVLPTGQVLGQKLSADDQATLQKLAMRLISHPEEIEKIRPTYGECRTMTSDQIQALRLMQYANGFYEFVKSEGGLPVQQKPVQAEVRKGKPDDYFPENAKKNLSEDYQKETAWFFVDYRNAKDENVGAFSGFTKVNGRWILVPRFHQAFSDRNRAASIFDTILQMLAENRTDDVYDLCSSRITETMDRAEAKAFFEKLGVTKIRKISPHSKGNQSPFGTAYFHRGMTVTFEDGRSAEIKMVLNREKDDDLKLVWIGLQSRLGIEPPGMFAPTPEECRRLAKGLFSEISLAMKGGDYQKLHAKSAQSLQDSLTVEQLKKAFLPLKELTDDVLKTDVDTVKLIGSPSLGFSSFSPETKYTFLPEKIKPPTGPLSMDLVFADKQGKNSIVARFSFQFEDGKWRPSGYGLEKAKPDAVEKK